MRAVVFIDGENLRYSINALFAGQRYQYQKSDYLPKEADWEKFSEHVVKESGQKFHGDYEHVRTYWYVIENIAIYPHLPKETEGLAKWRGKYQHQIRGYPLIHQLTDDQMREEFDRRKNEILRRFDGRKKIQHDIMTRHTALEFRRSGTIFYNLFTQRFKEEKTVDVNLAVDMVSMKDFYDLFIIVSGDQDYLPAVQAVKNVGKRVVNVAFAKMSGELLPGGSKQLNAATDSNISLRYDELSKLLSIKEI